MDSSWTSGVVGGLVVAAFLYGARIPQAVDENDLRVEEIEIDLRRWTRDEERNLRDELDAIDSAFRERHLVDSGLHVAAQNAARDRRGQASRDRLSLAQRGYDNVVVSERLFHRAWRWLRRRPLYRLTAPLELRHAIERWGEANGSADGE
jgi:hypothetical protein